MGEEHKTYEGSGVSITAQDAAIAKFRARVSATHGREVLEGVGSFGAAFAPDLAAIAGPVLVSSTDGVGTKVRLHAQFGTHQWAGADLVAAVVNDVLCSGAQPLFFLDYYACNKVVPDIVNQVVGGMADVCESIHCALIGGEIAEMGDVYRPDEYDLAGFAVGLVDRHAMLGPARVKAGDVLIGLASSGVHCNGFSLVRSALADLSPAAWLEPDPRLGDSLRNALLHPTRCYARPIVKLARQGLISAAAHISGGGLEDNLPRIIPDGLCARVDRRAVPTPAVFDIIRAQGNVTTDEMWHVFNMGVGFVAAAAPRHQDAVLSGCQSAGCPAFIIGRVEHVPDADKFGWIS